MGLAGLGLAAVMRLGPSPGPQWEVPATCPAVEAFTAAVEHWVGRPVDAELSSLRARVQAQADGFVLTLALGEDAHALRETLSDPDCRVLTDAAALKVAFAIDPEATTRALESAPPASEPEPAPTQEPVPEPMPEPRPAPDPRPAPAPVSAAEPDPAPEPRRCAPGPSRPGSRPCVDLGARAGLQVGSLPRVGPGIAGHIGVLWPRLALELGATHWFRQSITRASSDAGGTIRLTVADLAACGRLGVATVEFPLCGGMELGAMYGRGDGVSDPQTDRLPWVAAAAFGRVVWVPIPRLSVFGQVGVAVPLGAYRFFVNGDALVHASAPAALRAGLGLSARLW